MDGTYVNVFLEKWNASEPEEITKMPQVCIDECKSPEGLSCFTLRIADITFFGTRQQIKNIVDQLQIQKVLLEQKEVL
jgi:hypothetical protein